MDTADRHEQGNCKCFCRIAGNVIIAGGNHLRLRKFRCLGAFNLFPLGHHQTAFKFAQLFHATAFVLERNTEVLEHTRQLVAHHGRFFECKVFATDKRAQKQAVSHDVRNVAQRILPDRRFSHVETEGEPGRFVGLHIHLEIFLEQCLGGIHGRNARFVTIGSESINRIAGLACKRPQKHALVFREINREQRRHGILEPLARHDELVPLLFVLETELLQCSGKALGTRCPGEILEDGAPIHEQRHEESQFCAFAVRVNQQIHFKQSLYK